MISPYDKIKSFLPEPCRKCKFFWQDLKFCTVHKKFSFEDAFEELDKIECYAKIKNVFDF